MADDLVVQQARLLAEGSYTPLQALGRAYLEREAQLAAMTAERDAYRNMAKIRDDDLAVMRAFRLKADAELQACIVQLTASEAARERYEAALEMIAGLRQCADNLMSNWDIARAALAEPGKAGEP